MGHVPPSAPIKAKGLKSGAYYLAEYDPHFIVNRECSCLLRMPGLGGDHVPEGLMELIVPMMSGAVLRAVFPATTEMMMRLKKLLNPKRSGGYPHCGPVPHISVELLNLMREYRG